MHKPTSKDTSNSPKTRRGFVRHQIISSAISSKAVDAQAAQTKRFA
ncbi:hypothetical protein [Comamonas fluminis]|nr:hypothetical protein [Comamonas fluminis]